MSKDLPTELQALYGSGALSGYICSFLPSEGLKKGWVEQGLSFKGVRSSLSTKTNQMKFVQPTEQIVSLMCDRAMDVPGTLGIALTGIQGINEEKFAVLLDDSSEPAKRKRVASLWFKTHSPYDIVKLAVKHQHKREQSITLREPHPDYVEYLKEAASDKKVREAFALEMPKRMADEALWIKNALNDPDGDNSTLLFRHGTLRETPAFALLFSKTLSELELAKPAKSLIFAALLEKPSKIEAVFWDMPRRVATFAIFENMVPEEVAWSYLLPLWAAPDERIEVPLIDSVDQGQLKIEREKIDAEDGLTKTSQIIDLLAKRVEALEKKLGDISISDTEKRLELAEDRAESLRVAVARLSELEETLARASAQETQDMASQNLLQSRLNDLLDRMEKVSSKLGKLEKRITKIGKDFSG